MHFSLPFRHIGEARFRPKSRDVITRDFLCQRVLSPNSAMDALPGVRSFVLWRLHTPTAALMGHDLRFALRTAKRPRGRCQRNVTDGSEIRPYLVRLYLPFRKSPRACFWSSGAEP